MRLKKSDFYALLGFFLFGFLFYWDILLGRAFIWEDLLEFLYPLRNFLAVSLKDGRIPLWIPGIFSGMPFLAEPQTAVFYPFNMVLALFVRGGRLPYLALEVQVILHLLLGGLGMYLYLRWKNLLVPGALVGAVVYSFSSFLVLHIIHGNLVNAAMWIPWLYWVFEIMVRRRSILFSGLLGLGLGIMASSGYPQLLVYFLLFLGGTLIYQWLQSGNWRERVLVTGLFAIAVVLFLGLWLWQLFPTSFLTQYTERQVLTFGLSAENSIPPHLLLLKLLVPKIHGSVSGIGTDYFGGPSWSYWEQGIYGGILPLLLWGLWIFRKRRPKEVLFFSFIAILSLWLAMGKYGGLYQVFYYLIFPLRRFRNPPRFSVFFFFSMAVIAGYSIQEIANWIKRNKGSSRQYQNFLLGFVAFSVLVLVLVLAWGGPVSAIGKKSAYLFFLFSSLGVIFLLVAIKTRNQRLLWGLPLIIGFDLYLFGSDFAKGNTNPRIYYSEMRLPREVREDRGIHRLNIRKGNSLVLPRNAGAVIPYETIDGYEVLRLKRYIEFYDSVKTLARYSLLNVKYRLEVDRGRPYFVVNEDFLPRAFFVDTLLSVPEDSVVDILRRPDFAPSRLAVTERPKRGGTFKKGEVKILDSKPQSLDLEVYVSEGEGYLVVSLVQYPEWEATIDGKITPWEPVDLTLMGLRVPEGRHTVSFRVRSRAFEKGGRISLLSLFISLVVIALGFLIETKRRGSEKSKGAK